MMYAESLGLRVYSTVVGAAFLILVIASFAPAAVAQARAAESGCSVSMPSDWTVQEQWVWERLCNHEVADLNVFSVPARVDSHEAWIPENILRPAFLEAVLLDELYVTKLANRRIRIRGAWFQSAIDLSDAHIRGALFLESSRFDGPLRLTGARVDGRFSVAGSTFNAELKLDSATVAGHVFLSDCGTYERVDLTNATIDGSVGASASTFNDELTLNGATVAGHVLLRQGGTYERVDLIGASIGSNVEAQGSTFNGEFDLDSATVAGHIFLRQGGIYQSVDLGHTSIGGSVDASASTFKDELNIESTHIRGSLDISGSTATGEVLLRGSTIEGDLRLGGADTQVMWGPNSVLDLRAVSIRGIDDSLHAWPAVVMLTGFAYRLPTGSGSTVGEGFINRSTDWYLDWLERQPAFSRQPYQQIEAALREVGRGGTADDIAVARSDKERDLLALPNDAPRYAVASLHRVTVLYGYHPELSILWMMSLWVAGIAVAARIPSAYRTEVGVTSNALFSFDRLVPLVSLHRADRDLDLRNGAVPWWVRWYFYFQTIAGYVLAIFVVTAIGRIAP